MSFIQPFYGRRAKIPIGINAFRLNSGTAAGTYRYACRCMLREMSRTTKLNKKLPTQLLRGHVGIGLSRCFIQFG